MGQVKEHIWKPPVLIPREKEESREVCGAGEAELLLGKCLSPHRQLGPTSAEPGPGPASEHPNCSSGPGLLGRGQDPQVQLDLEHVSVCVNTLGWALEIQEASCHIWVSPCRSCARLLWMSLELVIACRGPLGHGSCRHWCLLGPTRCRKGQDVLTSSTKGVLEDGDLPS